MSLTQVIETGVADAQKALALLETQKQQVVASLQTHITNHQKAAAQHNAEVAAAQQIIQQAYPSATLQAADAAAFILTSKSTWVAGVVSFLGRNWRYVAIGLILVSVVVACHTGLVKVP